MTVPPILTRHPDGSYVVDLTDQHAPADASVMETLDGTPEHSATSHQYDLVILANRLPVSRQIDADVETWESSPGGLAAALSPVLTKYRSAWVGWLGDDNPDDGCFDREGVHLVPLALSSDEISGFYDGFSNGTLWPLYHDAIRPPRFEREWWETYEAVNARYADLAARVASPGGAVWVHDYHLQLVPALLRARRPDLRIGFFLHIPYPPQELFMQLPWRRAILEGMLGADLVGFQVPTAAHNFGVLARRLTTAKGGLPTLAYRGRNVKVGAFPISIDVARFSKMASAPETAIRTEEIRSQLGRPKSVLLGVDRLDYTKGIQARLRAYRELLADGHVTVADCVLVQIAVPSREDVADYTAEREAVERLVGEINGQFGNMGAPAVHYLHRSVSFEELVALYRAADVMLVTPFVDGMNLVAKEYVACRMDNTGTLILSEFAGAARELRAASLVNPHDITGIKEAIVSALGATGRDVMRRMRSLRRSLHQSDVHNWATSVLAEISGSPVSSPQ
jgi:trehalose 6-phosphate synthase